MAKGCASNTYEAARNQQVELNKRKFQDLGILKISKSLADLSNSEKRSPQRPPKPKSKTTVLEPRRSSRVRNPVPSYRDDIAIDLPPLRKRSRSSKSWGSYLARPLDEVRMASQEERDCAFEAAVELESNLKSGNPSCVKSMALPNKFCEDHLPKTVLEMVLEDEDGVEFEATYIGKRTGLSGGWRAFALDHKLDDGDAVVFELTEPTRFKVYIVRAFPVPIQEQSEETEHKEVISASKTTSKARTQKSKKATAHSNNDDLGHPKKRQPESETNSQERSREENPTKNGSVCRRIQKKGKTVGENDLKKDGIVEKNDGCASWKPRKKPAPKLFRKKAFYLERVKEAKLFSYGMQQQSFF